MKISVLKLDLKTRFGVNWLKCRKIYQTTETDISICFFKKKPNLAESDNQIYAQIMIPTNHQKSAIGSCINHQHTVQ